MKNPIKIYNLLLLLRINLLLISIYLLDTFIIFPETSAGVLTLVSKKPFILVIVKCSYALLLMNGLLNIESKSNRYWTLLNLSSIGVLSLWLYSFMYYTSYIDMFLLELSSLIIIIITNLKVFITSYGVKRDTKKIITILLIPIAIVIYLEIII